MYCMYCGTQIPQKANFCGKCGKKVEIQEGTAFGNEIVNQVPPIQSPQFTAPKQNEIPPPQPQNYAQQNNQNTLQQLNNQTTFIQENQLAYKNAVSQAQLILSLQDIYKRQGMLNEGEQDPAVLYEPCYLPAQPPMVGAMDNTQGMGWYVVGWVFYFISFFYSSVFLAPCIICGWFYMAYHVQRGKNLVWASAIMWFWLLFYTWIQKM